MTSDLNQARQLFLSGTAALENGELESAENDLLNCLALVPDRDSVKNNLSILYQAKGDQLADSGDHENALKAYDQAIYYNSNNFIAYSNKGVLLFDQFDRVDDAIDCYEKAISLNSNFSDALQNMGVAKLSKKEFSAALDYLDRSLSIDPNLHEAWSNRGNALHGLGRHEEAESCLRKATALEPNVAEIWNNLGTLLSDLGRPNEALEALERSVILDSNSSMAWNNLGKVLIDLQKPTEALSPLYKAIKINPKLSEAWNNQGHALAELRRYEEALKSYERAIELKPDGDFWLGHLIHTQMNVCDWTELDRRRRTLEQKLLAGIRVSTPLPVLGLLDDPSLHKRCSELFAKDKLFFNSRLGVIGKMGKKEKIRVAYFSMDFKEHPVAHLMAELIDCHDRTKFEVYGFSFGMNTGDAMRKRLENSFDRFLDVGNLKDLDIANLARENKIDIAIDLGGYTKDSRSTIFAHRAAPIQINYLGFPGTMGTEHLDYFVGDSTTVSDENLEHFSEKVIFLPNSFQVNPSERPIASRNSARAAHGLPNHGFIFCCFNNVWKITPEVFKLWAQIIQRVNGSVLWLQNGGQTAVINLVKEFELRGLSSDRIIFADKVPSLSDHLNRYQLADLFLDTFPYGAHTTASDALWAGLPVLTRSGKSFASRVASSLLNTVGLPELVTHTEGEYESVAIELASNPEKIASLKARLAESRETCPLFNTTVFTQHIESAYQVAYDRYHQGLAPEHIYVKA